MSDINIAISGSAVKRLKTAGKYCDKDILVTADGSGTNTDDATAVAADIAQGKTAYAKGEKLTGTKKDPDPVEQATPTISVSSSGMITASATQDAGLVSAGTTEATMQLDTQEEQTITPGTSNKTISSGLYLTGTQTIKGDANLIANNIKTGVRIFNVTGAYEGGGIDTSDATAVEEDIAKGKTAYVNGEKITGIVNTLEEDVFIDIDNAKWNYNKGGLQTGFGLASGAPLMLKANGKYVYIEIAGTAFGDASANDVASGKTFTSANGLKMVGTLENNGIDTSDATAVEEDIAFGKTAYVDGEKITGIADVLTEDSTVDDNRPTWNSQKGALRTSFGVIDGTPLMLKNNGKFVFVDIAGSTLGNAAASDVAEGKTFTSQNGLKLTGTLKASAGLPDGVKLLATGTVTPAEDNTSGLVVTHSLGSVPHFCAWFVEADYSSSTATTAAVAGAVINKATKYTSTSSISYNIHYVIDGYSSSSQQTTTSGRVSNTSYMTATQARLICNSSYPIKAGKRIRWVVGVLDGVL